MKLNAILNLTLANGKLNNVFRPKLLTMIKGYSVEKFAKDVMAGIIVGIVALPLAIAFGIASGVSPEKGLVTAIIGGFIVSLLGGCSVQIGGPTGAFIIIVYGVIQQYGAAGLAVATVLAGLMLVGMGLLRLGNVIKFIPYPRIVGFTSGIALVIFTTQIKDLLGLALDNPPADFVSKWIAYAKAARSINLPAFLTGIASIVIIVLCPKFIKKIPGSLVAVVVVTTAVYLLKRFLGVTGIETIADRFEINAAIPLPETVSINMETVNTLMPVAFTIAVLSAIESLLSATVADGVTNDKQNSNTELIAQGAANIITPIFGGIPVTGAIARTMTNINNGGQTPVAGIIHAVVLLLILLFLGPLTKHIPMACLAGVLIIVAYNMSEWRTFRSLMKNPRSDVIVLLVTFLLTVIFDLTIAIEAGILLAMVLLVKRIAETATISVSKDEINMENDAERTDDSRNHKLPLPPGVEVYEIDGPFFFGIASKFENSMRWAGADAKRAQIRIIRMRKVPFMDSTGLHNLETLYRMSEKEGTQLVLSGVNEKVKAVLEKSEFHSKIGQENICRNITEALERVKQLTQ
ncbi:MAG: sulfate permease [Dysgonamonadaceae bacterium]|jgi:SulP family sulfate permease|nr:sulfate permease [Dysgonamonadaceae bacterium]